MKADLDLTLNFDKPQVVHCADFASIDPKFSSNLIYSRMIVITSMPFLGSNENPFINLLLQRIGT